MGALWMLVATNGDQDWECRSLFSEGEMGELMELQWETREGIEMVDEAIPLNCLLQC